MSAATLLSDPERESVQVLFEFVAAPETAPVETSIGGGIDTHGVLEGGIDITTITVDMATSSSLISSSSRPRWVSRTWLTLTQVLNYKGC